MSCTPTVWRSKGNSGNAGRNSCRISAAVCCYGAERGSYCKTSGVFSFSQAGIKFAVFVGIYKHVSLNCVVARACASGTRSRAITLVAGAGAISRIAIVAVGKRTSTIVVRRGAAAAYRYTWSCTTGVSTGSTYDYKAAAAWRVVVTRLVAVGSTVFKTVIFLGLRTAFACRCIFTRTVTTAGVYASKTSSLVSS